MQMFVHAIGWLSVLLVIGVPTLWIVGVVRAVRVHRRLTEARDRGSAAAVRYWRRRQMALSSEGRHWLRKHGTTR